MGQSTDGALGLGALQQLALVDCPPTETRPQASFLAVRVARMDDFAERVREVESAALRRKPRRPSRALLEPSSPALDMIGWLDSINHALERASDVASILTIPRKMDAFSGRATLKIDLFVMGREPAAILTEIHWYEDGSIAVSVALQPAHWKEDVETRGDVGDVQPERLEDWYQHVLLRHLKAYCERE